MSATGILKDGWLNECYYKRSDGSVIEYKLRTDPPEAIFWSTYKLKKSDIRIVTKGFDRAEAAALRQEILDSINTHERECKEAIDAHRNSTNKTLRRNASRKKS